MNDLVGLSTFARQVDKPPSTLQRYETRPDFPKPILVIQETRRTKRLWEKSALDRYFQQVESERRAKHELARERAARKRANSALHRWAITMFGPIDGALIKREELRQHDGDPESVCRKLKITY